jgi:hypothetical protein
MCRPEHIPAQVNTLGANKPIQAVHESNVDPPSKLAKPQRSTLRSLRAGREMEIRHCIQKPINLNCKDRDRLLTTIGDVQAKAPRLSNQM